jgi:hypothetical protein
MYQRKRSLVITMLISMSVITALAQRNLIDVPSSEIVEKRKLFLQGQATFSADEFGTSAIVTYGLKNSFEIGATFHQFVFKKSQGIEIGQEHPEENPDFLINAQKGITLTNYLKLGVGSRSGVNAAKANKDLTFVNFDYLNSQFTIGESEHKLLAGVYYANTAYAVEGTKFGVMAGADIVLIKEKLHLISDFISGTSALSVINAGVQISIGREWELTVGGQFPTPGSGNSSAAVLQISKNNSKGLICNQFYYFLIASPSDNNIYFVVFIFISSMI